MRRLYTTVTGDGGGVRTRGDMTETRIEVRFERNGMNLTALMLSVVYEEGAEAPYASLTTFVPVELDDETIDG